MKLGKLLTPGFFFSVLVGGVMMNQLQRSVFVASVLSMLVAPSGWAESLEGSEARTAEGTNLAEIPQLSEMERSATTVAEWMAQTQGE